MNIKKTLIIFAVLWMVTLNVTAQQVSITLNPGWNWISFTSADTLDFNTALGSFTPAMGDIIKSQSSFNYYDTIGWNGNMTHFIPGIGYMYCSMRDEAVSFMFSGTSVPVLETTNPAYITSVSAVVGGNVTLGEDNQIFACGVCWGTDPKPTVAGNHTFEGTLTGDFSSLLMELVPNTTYYTRAYVVTYCGLAYGEEKSFTTLASSEIHCYVDLNLPSGLWWATCNVGAIIPEDYGDYFAWGETSPKDIYNWSTYQHCNESENALTKYCDNPDNGYEGFTDTLSTLLFEDDAASVNYGAEWRIPNWEEWEELCQNTTSIWTTQNGVNGRRFIASNGNSIFLPAAGVRIENELNGSGESGLYWSSSLNIDNPIRATAMSTDMEIFGARRCLGYSVRAVRPAKNHFYVLSAAIDAPETFEYVTDVLNSAYEYPDIINPHVDIVLSNKPSTVEVEDDEIHGPVGAQRKSIVAVAPIDYNVVKLYSLGFDQMLFDNVTPITLPYSASDPTLYHVFVKRNTGNSGYLANRIVFRKQ